VGYNVVDCGGIGSVVGSLGCNIPKNILKLLFLSLCIIYDILDGVPMPVGDLPESVIIVHEDDAEKIGTIKSHRVVLSSSWERGDTGLRSWIDSAVQPVLLAVKAGYLSSTASCAITVEITCIHPDVTLLHVRTRYPRVSTVTAPIGVEMT